jgi:rod shape-determining protein MreC
MRRRAVTNRHWLILAVGLVALLALGETTGLRSRVIKTAASVGSVASSASPASAWAQERSQLIFENRRLRQELERVVQLWRHDRASWGRLQGMPQEADQPEVSGLLQQWRKQLGALHQKVVAARLIYRDPLPWGSTFWIDVGADQISANSPVVIGNSLVGLVDYVGSGCSRVRCVTDADLVVAVRVARGMPQAGMLLHHVEALLSGLEPQEEWTAALMQLRERLSHPRELAYLAKGEVVGSGNPLWQGSGTLKGSGFNHDTADALGGSRDLRSANLIEEGDLLITSGLDGIFPPGLDVGWVTHLEPLRQGAIGFEAEVRAAAPQLGHLETIFVLPSPFKEDISHAR